MGAARAGEDGRSVSGSASASAPGPVDLELVSSDVGKDAQERYSMHPEPADA